MTSENTSQRSKEEDAGILPSQGIAVDLHKSGQDPRPTNIRHVSAPAYESPLRHHRRNQSNPRAVKETLHARSEYTNSQDEGGGAIHRINQYIVKQEIGRGSFGAVHLAADQYGNEYAVKEFSKSRLRRRAQSNILRRPHAARQKGAIASGLGFSAIIHRQSTADLEESAEAGNPLYLINEEIAIMKKLNHGNLVALIEVLDDPSEDSLYMVLEMCKKGVIMKVGVDEIADPYDAESCRCWFRDLILGIEYLHAQGVIHRDIKPDNLLLTEDDVLKIVDFGVSEMFEKQSEMKVAKEAGSPAFLPPELCVAKHGDVSGKAADIWSMGVTLYCLIFGCLPFQEASVLRLYESIQGDEIEFSDTIKIDDNLKDIIRRLLDKDPSSRITMDELREHPWVTKGGKDPLLSAKENTINMVEPPTQEEKDHAITGNLNNVVVLVSTKIQESKSLLNDAQMKAVKKFKKAIAKKRPPVFDGILGRDHRIVQPPLSMDDEGFQKPSLIHKTRSMDAHDRRPIETALVTEGLHRDIDLGSKQGSTADREDTKISLTKSPTWSTPKRPSDPGSTNLKRELDAEPRSHRIIHSATFPLNQHHGKGHAHDPLEDHLYLNLGPTASSRPPSPPAVSESPPAADIDIYETAYRKEVERLRAQQGRSATLFLTRRVERLEHSLKDHGLISGASQSISRSLGGFTKVIEAAQSKAADDVAVADDEESELEQGLQDVDQVTKGAADNESAQPAPEGRKGGDFGSLSKLVKQVRSKGVGTSGQD
ncbi:uncharacterized protein KY384_003727 [Bacidia gigantensis]|uniref:uncharacterized protein n=1 Tax=Bacidia gigantensis TaxID=2732470 RepID=UPI001D04734D|nr:uncharacterized protein KY384_003727 [Bacidia gigantensis]KAG8532090.1 hypothetical protein KY384_003727 [Bacidia gigantensis]